MKNVRIGQGYDVHIFGDGDHVMLGGVRLEHNLGIIAHSDGDVVLHSLCDAIYGALGAGDIGTFFPPSDEQWRNTPSIVFLEHAHRLLAEGAWQIGNIDITVVAEAPKLTPARDDIVENIASLLEIDASKVSIKATTHEKMGAFGRGEGLAALSVVLIFQE